MHHTRVVHFEIPADNEERPKTFYQKAFGWDISKYPGMEYHMVGTSEMDQKTQMSGTSTVMTVFLTSLLRFVSPPLMAPGFVGIWVFWSISVVPTMWYSIPGYLLMSHPKAFW